jgi:RNA polymerase sigma factor (sigma-70 family)
MGHLLTSTLHDHRHGTQMNDPLADAARRAAHGDRAALDEVCRGLQDPLYAFALRMFSQPADAADATQEVLITIITNLGSFEGRSKLSTWAYTIASRQFLRMKRRAVEDTVADANTFGEWLDRHRAEPGADTVANIEFAELCAEVRIGCTYGMLLCLSREHRIAYLLGDVIGFTDIEGAAACDVTPAAFRQRLSRARHTMRNLMESRCGLIRSSNPCRCSHIVEASIASGIINSTNLVHARGQATPPIGNIEVDTIRRAATELDVAVAIAEVFRSDPAWNAPAQVWTQLQAALPTLLTNQRDSESNW